MSSFDFELGDFFDDESLDEIVAQNAQNVNPRGDSMSLKTSRSQDSTPRRGLTTASTSDLLQGVGVYVSSGQTISALNQSISSDLSYLLATEGGIDGILGARKGQTAWDIMSNKGLDDGKFSSTSQLALEVIGTNAITPGQGTIVGDAVGEAAKKAPKNVPVGSTPESLGLENGKIDTSYMVYVGKDPGGEELYLWQPAAESYLMLKEKAEAEGVDLTLSEAYRTIERQEYFWHCYQTGSCNNGNTAARPGTSNHGWGRAIDIAGANGYGDKVHSWMTANAIQEGWICNVPNEPWHWAFGTGG